MNTTKNKPNHLIKEKSPYLLQHAYNPVDWYPWGEEAFNKAKKENKPIFLSIGYTTCHWCHVMEKESFSNQEIADLLNKDFVAIKVDREERPDIDKIYMTAVQAMTGSGGWPLSVWLTPDLKPFTGGTYFPPDERWGRPGFSQILNRISDIWKNEPDKLIESGNHLIEGIAKHLTVEDEMGVLDPTAFTNAFKVFEQSYDSSTGGFRSAPKFPMPSNHNFLLRYYASSKNKAALEMSLFTLKSMAKGGIYDHIGGGFHRYSTDSKWHIPHFEKMLYDNSQIAINYLEAYQLSEDKSYAETARETLDYVLETLSHPEGGYYSAEDADSLPPELAGKASNESHEHKSEGAFYIWEQKEIIEQLGKEIAEIFNFHYGVQLQGNAEEDPHGEFTDKNILYKAYSIKETAKKFNKSEKELEDILSESKSKLFQLRAKRPRPQLDDKILVSWNGLMISAMAKAGQVLIDPKYILSAKRSAEFIKNNLYDHKNKTLYRRWRDGEKKVRGIASDYSFLVQGLLDLYEASFEVQWLEWALELTDTQNKLFYDKENGGYFMTEENHDKYLLIRTKEDSDNVIPSASSIAVMNLLRLHQYTDRDDLRQAADKTLKQFATRMKEQPTSLPQMMVAMDFALSKPRQIILVGKIGASDTQELLKEVHSRFIPNKILLLIDQDKNRKLIEKWLPFTKNILAINQKATAYVCIDYSCQLPTNDLNVFKKLLEDLSPE